MNLRIQDLNGHELCNNCIAQTSGKCKSYCAVQSLPIVNLADQDWYINTHFRIKSKYTYKDGWNTLQEQAMFDLDTINIFHNLGFILRPPSEHIRTAGYRGGEFVYCHPQDISGWLKRESILEISEALSKATEFTVRNVDTYEACLNFTPDEFMQELQSRRDCIEGQILEKLATKRKDWFHTHFDAMSICTNIPYFDRHRDFTLRNILDSFITEILNDLVAQGRIAVNISAHGLKAYRTINSKKRLKK